MRSTNLLTVQEAAQLLGVADVTVWRYLAKGVMKKVQVAPGHRVFVPWKEVLRIKSGGTAKDYPPPKRKRNSDV